MDSTASISKGCFVFKNGFKSGSKNQKKVVPKLLFEEHFTNENWYTTYRSMWLDIEEKVFALNSSTYSKVLHELVTYVKDCFNYETSLFTEGIIPSATLLTGINQPDHDTQFTALKNQLLSEVTPHVAIIYSQDSSSVKQIIENLVAQFINEEIYDTQSDSEPECPTHRIKNVCIKKSQCNMNVLKAWFHEMYSVQSPSKLSSPSKRVKSNDSTNHLVVIIPDFESFNCDALQDLILILSGYTPSLPFVLIFGVATAVSALHKSFPYHVSSKLHVQVFQSHSSTTFLNQVLESIFLTYKCPFHLSGKPFKLLIDVFLFYDFSVSGFIQALKYCMMEHYFASKIHSLCCPRELTEEVVNQLLDADLESVRHLPSFRPYVESQKASVRISLLLKNDYLRTDLLKCLNNLHDYLFDFHAILQVLLIFVGNLPNAPLGKQVRELYSVCVTSSVIESPEYKQCVLLLGFLSKHEIVDLLNQSIVFIKDLLADDVNTPTKKREAVFTPTEPLSESCNKNMIAFVESIENFKIRLENANLQSENVVEKEEQLPEKLNRHNLNKKLLQSSLKEKPLSEYEAVRRDLLSYLTKEVFEMFLKPPNSQVFHELFFFSDVYKVKKQIVGTPRASIHTALNNPFAYLQCKCCELSNTDTILQSLPDLSIAYKLHLECGKLINLYDWLQAFITIIDPIEHDEFEEERRDIHPDLHARFTRVVSELQFLGFIKTSKRKTDHVTRLTW